MGLIKWILKLFGCKSQCQFNEQVFSEEYQITKLEEYALKHKDIQRIHRILSKRERRPRRTIKRIDTPHPGRMVTINEV